MKYHVLTGARMVAVLGFAPLVAHADSIPDRATLEGLLGGGGTLEDFEVLEIPQGGQRRDSSGFLDSTSMFDGDGPGLVQPGARYSAPSLFWNGDGYFALDSQTLGDSTGWRDWQITIDYDPSITAFGFDMQGYQGFGMAGTVSVFDTVGDLISTTNVNGGFFGWEDANGIGSVVIDTQVSNNYVMIDDHLFGQVVGGCPADIDGDGDADADDFFAYLDAFAAGNLDICDIDGDGDCDADDFFAYLDLFAAGCD